MTFEDSKKKVSMRHLETRGAVSAAAEMARTRESVRKWQLPFS